MTPTNSDALIYFLNCLFISISFNTSDTANNTADTANFNGGYISLTSVNPQGRGILETYCHRAVLARDYYIDSATGDHSSDVNWLFGEKIGERQDLLKHS